MEQQLYWNGPILTMEDRFPQAEALLVENGRILATGSKEALLSMASSSIKKIDLEGATLLPSFLDSHSHFTSYANSLLQVPLEGAASFADIVGRIKAFVQDNGIPKGKWVVGAGYDHNQLEEGLHPPLSLLDGAAPDNPLILQHQSGHMGVLNSLALTALGITPETPSPSGGKIGVEDGALTGYLEENAFIGCLKRIPINAMGDLMGAFQETQNRYLRYGITTVQDGMAVDGMVPLYQQLCRQKKLKLDLVAYGDMDNCQRLLEAFPSASYQSRFRIGGYKMFLDGSPQGRTAWMREPYQGAPHGERGYPILTDAQVEEKLTRALREGRQILAHCNGDAACLQYISAYQQARRKEKGPDIRPVIVHAQLLPRELLPLIGELGMIPSFFVAHIYHWGDVHCKNFGIERASGISPAASAGKRGIPYTFHQDAPVIQPDMLETLWCAVERRTKRGVLLGLQERVPVWDALKAVTIHAAYQYFEEEKKGSLAPGKLANLVVLSGNPLTVQPEELRKLQVLQTIREGEILYQK